MKKTKFVLSIVAVLCVTVSLSGAREQSSGKTAGLAAATDIAASAAPADWKAWAAWAEKLYPITDSLGHGPDIGSDEWASALAQQLGVSGVVGSTEWREAVEQKLTAKTPPPTNIKRELLSAHDTEASFLGLKDHQCMGLTSLCPDRCGESGKLAVFKIVKYLDYKKPGEYGDPKQEEFMVLIEDNRKRPRVPAAIRDAILALKPGELVHLKWHHDYVTKDGASFPGRPIVTLEPLRNNPATNSAK